MGSAGTRTGEAGDMRSFVARPAGRRLTHAGLWNYELVPRHHPHVARRSRGRSRRATACLMGGECATRAVTSGLVSGAGTRRNRGRTSLPPTIPDPFCNPAQLRRCGCEANGYTQRPRVQPQLRFQIRRPPEVEAFPANFVRVARLGGDIVSTFVARGSRVFAVDVHASVATARSMLPLSDQLAVQSVDLKAALGRENLEVAWDESLEGATFPWLPIRAAITMANELLEHGIVIVNFACPSPLALPAPDPALGTIVLPSALEVAVPIEVFAYWISALARVTTPTQEV